MAAKTRFDKKVDWVKNHKYLSTILFLAFALGLFFTYKKIVFPSSKKNPDPTKVNKEQNTTINNNEDKSTRKVNINMHDSSHIDNVINGDQTNNYMVDSLKKK